MTVHQLRSRAIDPHLVQVVQQAKKDYEETFELARQMCSFLIEEAASAQRDNREKDAAIEELQREVHMREVEVNDLRRELDEAEARYDRLRWRR